MSTTLRSHVVRQAWPERPRTAHDFSLLSPARWRRLAARLGEDTAGTRRVAEAALRALYTGSALGERRHWRVWMRDGTWVDFWAAYVRTLSPHERRAWRRALSRPSRGDTARRLWQLVSARLLWDRE